MTMPDGTLEARVKRAAEAIAKEYLTEYYKECDADGECIGLTQGYVIKDAKNIAAVIMREVKGVEEDGIDYKRLHFVNRNLLKLSTGIQETLWEQNEEMEKRIAKLEEENAKLKEGAK